MVCHVAVRCGNVTCNMTQPRPAWMVVKCVCDSRFYLTRVRSNFVFSWNLYLNRLLDIEVTEEQSTICLLYICGFAGRFDYSVNIFRFWILYYSFQDTLLKRIMWIRDTNAASLFNQAGSKFQMCLEKLSISIQYKELLKLITLRKASMLTTTI